ncbi:MAG: hypothetical protein ISR85_02300 [Kiritimatiellales bacterium]|nr:hypothetical protein [Kiritimatiellales bacterium]
MKKITLSVIALLSLATLSASAFPPPEKDEIPVDEIKELLRDLNGKVVEMEFAYAQTLSNVGSGNYTIFCGRFEDRGGASFISKMTVHFSGEEALEYFKDLSEQDVAPFTFSLGESVYVLVDGNRLRALGTRYKKSKGTYSW